MNPSFLPQRVIRTVAEMDAEVHEVRLRNHWGLGVFTAVFTPTLTHMLLVQLGEYAALRYGGRPWTLPGGGAEPGEAASAAAVRELAEECQLTLPPERLQPVGWFARPYFQGRWERPGEIVVLFAAIGPEGGGMPNNEETTNVIWYPTDFPQLAQVPPEGTGTHPLQPLPRHWYHWARLAHRALTQPQTPLCVHEYATAAALADSPPCLTEIDHDP